MTKRKNTILKIVLAVCIIGGVAVVLGRNSTEHTVKRELAAGDDKSSEGYTWEEYQALSLEEQDAFYQAFESDEDFETWLKVTKPAEEVSLDLNWKKTGKKPDAYNWEEYQSLSAEDRDAFFNWFASKEAFEDWKDAVEPVENIVIAKWNEAEKQPSEYTWEEYEALDAKRQEAFYQWFESTEDFEKWMKTVKPEEKLVPDLNWKNVGRLPNEYTWKEYQALSLEEQDAFFLWFGSVEAFETWMKKETEESSDTKAKS